MIENRLEKIHRDSALYKSGFNSLVASAIGFAILGMGIVSLSNTDEMGILFVAIASLFILGAVANYATTHYLSYPDRWYYLAPKIVMKKMIIKVVGLF